MINNLPNGWKIEELNNCGKIITGKTPSKKIDEYWNSNDISFIKPDDFDKNRIIYFEKGKDFISQKGFEKAVKIPSNSVLTTCIGNIGNVLINKFETTINQQINAILPNENINFKYLAYAIKKIKPIMVDRANAPVVPIINKTDFGKFSIPIPPLQQQEKIVKVLDLTSNLIEKQKELLEKYDLFLKSKFIEMFGDPISNPMGWEIVNFEDIMVLQRGYDLPINDRAIDGNIEVYGSNGVLDYHSEAKVKNGGVITGRSGTLGKVHYTLGDYWPLNTTLFSKDLKSNNIIYLAYFLEMFKVERFSQGAGVPTLNRNLVHKEKTYKVPLELQNKFASIVEKIETIKEKENQKLKQLEDLHNSMMNKAFKGEIE